MTDIWAVDVTAWWLPNNQGYPPVLRAVRDFIEFRERLPPDSVAADIREMNGIFRSLEISSQDVPPHLKEHIDPDTFGVVVGEEVVYESSPDHGWS